jgi:uncharacterized protein DUF6624
MNRLTGISARIVLTLLTYPFAAPLIAAAPHTTTLVDPKAFVDAARSGQLDPEGYDFESAGFFHLALAERMQWQVGLFGALGLADGSGPPPCSLAASRNGSALAWGQIAAQSADASEWKTTARTLRARLAELDQLVTRSAPEKPSAEPLVQELLERYARDQDVRKVFVQPKWTEGLTPAVANNWTLAAGTRVEAIDCGNTAWLKTQLARIGWFTISKYGAEADTAAWHLVQHADREPAFQREALVMLQALPPGQTSGKRLGTLVDRVARAGGGLQRYGTQGQCKDGQWTPFESEDPSNLDQRRAALGMEPIAEHMKVLSRENCPLVH